MNSQFSTPLLIPQDGASQSLERIPLSASDASNEYNETWLQKLLFEHPEALPINEIDPAYCGAVPICIELNTPVGPIDALFVTPQGKLVVLEAKLWRNPEARRTVVGQILDYAKELSRWTYEDLQREVSRRTERQGNSLFDIVNEATGELTETEFVDEVARGLRQGRFLLLICGDGIREGVAAITDFLERHGTLQFTFGLVEMAMYRTSRDETLVQPRVLAQSLIVKRSVISLVDEGLVAVEEGEAEQKLDETGEYYIQFWTDFAKRLKLDDPAMSLSNPTRRGHVFLNMRKDTHAWINVYCDRDKNSVGVFLTFYRGELGDRIFKQLEEDREEIDEDLGIPIPVEWQSNDGKNRVLSSESFPDIRDARYRDEIQEFLCDRTNRFVNTFRNRIERIVECL